MDRSETEKKIMELQQSPLYAQYIKSLGWTVATVDGINIFIRPIPFMGGLAKIQRPQHLPETKKLIPLLKNFHIRTLAVEATETTNQQKFSRWCQELRPFVHIGTSPFLPTKTIIVDVIPSETEIFQNFTEAKRRAVRRAEKNGVTVITSNDIEQLIQIKNKSAGFLGFITTHGARELWNVSGPTHATTLLAYSQKNHLIGGIFLLFWNKTAYYWIAGATKEGKKIFAPTLLVWEALKLAKQKGARQLDFLGVWDERMPKQNTSWQGFTKFKEGFGGKIIYYPLSSQ